MLVFSFLIMVSFWVFMFKKQVYQLSNLSSGETETVGGIGKNLVGPVSAIIEGVKSLKSDVTEKVSSLKSNSEGEIIERPAYDLPVY